MPRLICAGSALADGGDGVRFDLATAQGATAAFAVRFDGRVYAWRNACAHIPVELDWNPGKFFDSSGLYLICATHGALYEPHSGLCVAGPCQGRSLERIDVDERDGNIYLNTPYE